MTAYLTKRAGEARVFALDWTELEAGERLAEDLGWMIVPQELDPEALIATDVRLGAARSEARLSGDRPDHVYHVSHRVRTSAGRVLSRALMLRIVIA